MNEVFLAAGTKKLAWMIPFLKIKLTFWEERYRKKYRDIMSLALMTS